MTQMSMFLFFLSFFLIIMSSSLIYNDQMMYFYLPIFNISSMELNISILLDWSSLLFMSTVLLISSSIFLYSDSYIPKNEHKRFSLILSLFIFSMILLTLSNNLFFMMLGWDGLGISSYILVIYYQNHKSSESGAITILSNRIGDIFILISISLLTLTGNWEFFTDKNFPIIILTLIIVASFTKSAQTPFSAWLPAAMAAPTPVSALVHSSTLVTAGVYMLIRTMSSFHPSSFLIITIISTMTLFFSGMSANWEQDMKKIIALSTLSQIALMMFAISIKSSNSAYFHLITHALFKSTMFLCAGIIIHESSYQDTRNHGAICNNSHFMMTSMGISSMALMGIPFMSGFFSKDLIIEMMLSNNINYFIMIMVLFSMGLTASYSSRLLYFTYKFIFKKQKDIKFHSPINMTIAILILSPLSITLGLILSWTIIQPQTISLPILMKMSTLLFIFLGMTSGIFLSFKSKSYLKLGNLSSSLWFLNFISSHFPLKMMSLSKMFWTLDKSWMEMSSAQGSFLMMKHYSKFPDILISSSLSILMSLFIMTLLSMS